MKKGRRINRCELTVLAVSLLTQDLHCLLVYPLSSSSSPPVLTLFCHSLALFFLSLSLFVPVLPLLLSSLNSLSVSLCSQ